MRHVERESADVMAYPVESGHTSGFGEGARTKGDREIVEE